MERFLRRHEGRIVGTIAGFDRVLFRGNLASICHIGGMDRFLSSQRVLYKNFAAFAQMISNRLKTHAEAMAQKQGRPFIYLPSSRQSKEDKARDLMERDQIKEGLICVLSCVEPCKSFTVSPDRQSKQLRLVSRERKCLHLYFYFMDREFGFMHIRLQTWLPLSIQVCLNGREYLARQLTARGINHEQVGNCFTRIEDFKIAQQLLDRLVQRKWENVLNAWARRVNPWLQPGGKVTLHPYYWTVRQSEYALDVLFRDAQALADIYPALVRHAIEHFSTEDVLRFLQRHINWRFAGEVKSDLQRRIEGVRIKHFVQENSIKMYDKAGSVLRIETTINQPKRFRGRRGGTLHGKRAMRWLPLRKGIVDLRRRVEISRAANERYLEALAVVGETRPAHQLLDPVARRVESDGRSYRPLRPISPDDSRLFRVILRGEFQLQGVRNDDVCKHLYPDEQTDPMRRRRATARVTRHLLLLRAHGLIYKVPHTHYYRITKKGHETMTTALIFRDRDLRLLAA